MAYHATASISATILILIIQHTGRQGDNIVREIGTELAVLVLSNPSALRVGFHPAGTRGTRPGTHRELIDGDMMVAVIGVAVRAGGREGRALGVGAIAIGGGGGHGGSTQCSGVAKGRFVKNPRSSFGP